MRNLFGTRAHKPFTISRVLNLRAVPFKSVCFGWREGTEFYFIRREGSNPVSNFYFASVPPLPCRILNGTALTRFSSANRFRVASEVELSNASAICNAILCVGSYALVPITVGMHLARTFTTNSCRVASEVERSSASAICNTI